MEKLQLVIAVLIFLCSVGMFATAIFNPSPMKALWIMFMGIVVTISFFLVRMSYKELKDESGNNK